MNLRKLADLVIFRTLAELRSEQQRSYAGLLWWAIRPLLSLAIYGFVFSYIFKVNEPHFWIFLFAGIISWEWFSSSTLRSANSVAANKSLMLLVKLDPALFPLSCSMVDCIKFMIGMVILLIALLVSGIGWHWSIFFLPLIIVCELIFCMGTGLIVSGITPLFPDFVMILTTLMQLWMFVSGVFYRISTFKSGITKLLAFNPVAVFIEQYRRILIDGICPDFKAIAYVLSLGILFVLLGYTMLQRLNRLYPKRW